jgi:alanyl-tRNA synthetase
VLQGAQAFMLYDTFGFPLEITQEVAAERGVDVDQVGFEQAMEGQRAMSQAAVVSVDVTADSVFAEVRDYARVQHAAQRVLLHMRTAPQIADSIGETAFAGYTTLSTQATVRALLVDGKSASSARAGQGVEIVLDSSPFYAESGGQVGDKGLLHVSSAAGQLSVDVSDVQKVGGGRLFLHYGKVVGDGELKVGALVTATVDSTLRRRVR